MKTLFLHTPYHLTQAMSDPYSLMTQIMNEIIYFHHSRTFTVPIWQNQSKTVKNAYYKTIIPLIIMLQEANSLPEQPKNLTL